MNPLTVRFAFPALLCLFGVALPSGAQERPLDTLRDLKTEVLRLHGEYQQSVRAEVARLVEAFPGAARFLEQTGALDGELELVVGNRIAIRLAIFSGICF